MQNCSLSSGVRMFLTRLLLHTVTSDKLSITKVVRVQHCSTEPWHMDVHGDMAWRGRALSTAVRVLYTVL